MATYGSDDVGFILVGGYNVIGVTTQIEETRAALTEDITVLGDAWEQTGATGIKRYELTQEGFYDDAADSVNAALVASHGVARVIAFGYEGNTAGAAFVGVAGPLQASYERTVKVNEFHKASAEYRAAGAIQDGVIVHALGERTTASGNTQAGSVDSGASSANGGAVYVQVAALNLDGGTGLSLTIQHSADNTTFATLATAASVTAAPDAERIVVAGTINRYLAVAWSFTGSAGAARSATFMVGVARD